MSELPARAFSGEQLKRPAAIRRCKRCDASRLAGHTGGTNPRKTRQQAVALGWMQPGNVGGRKTSIATTPASPNPSTNAQRLWHRALIQVAANTGDVHSDLHTTQARFSLGNNYRDGHGAATDLVEAAWFYRLAACRGHAEAQVELGILYQAGTGVEKDWSIAARCFQRAADHGHVDGLHHLHKLEMQTSDARGQLGQASGLKQPGIGPTVPGQSKGAPRPSKPPAAAVWGPASKMATSVGAGDDTAPWKHAQPSTGPELNLSGDSAFAPSLNAPGSPTMSRCSAVGVLVDTGRTVKCVLERKRREDKKRVPLAELPKLTTTLLDAMRDLDQRTHA